MPASLKGLLAKLNPTSRSALERAAALCKSSTHYDVTVEHYLIQLLDGDPDTDVPRLCARGRVDPTRLALDLTRILDRMRKGNSGTPSFHPMLRQWLGEAWMIGSLDYGCTRIRGAVLLLALYTQEDLAVKMRDFSAELRKMTAESLSKDVSALIAQNAEEARADAATVAG